MSMKVALNLDTIVDLKAAPIADGAIFWVTGAVSAGDGRGGCYKWSPGSTAQVDNRFYRVVKSNLSETGRWMRTYSFSRELPQGIFGSSANGRILNAATTLDINGECVINLTEDNTPTGTALFSEVWTVTYDPRPANLTDPNNIVVGNVKSLTAKVLTCKFSRGNSLVGALGLTLLGMRAAAQGTPVNIRVEGL